MEPAKNDKNYSFGLVDELKNFCMGTRRAETCVALRLDIHVDASRGALSYQSIYVVAVFVKFIVVLALSAIILFEFLRTSSSSSSSMGRKARGGMRCQTFLFCSISPASIRP